MWLAGGGQNSQVFQTYDQLNMERRSERAFFHFSEPSPFPDFYPTYKKFENRDPLDYSDPSWVRKCYRVRYKEPFYKGGKVKERTPGYCDRILFRSLPDLASDLVPETVNLDLSTIGGDPASLTSGSMRRASMISHQLIITGPLMTENACQYLTILQCLGHFC